MIETRSKPREEELVPTSELGPDGYREFALAAAGAPATLEMEMFTRAIEPADFLREWPEHAHVEHELLWGITGGVEVETPAGISTVPTGFDLWIPASVPHRVRLAPERTLRCSWFARTPSLDGLPEHPILFASSTLLHEILEYLSEFSVADKTRRRGEELARDVLASSSWEPSVLPLPRSPDLRRAAEEVLSDLRRPIGVADLSATVFRSYRSFTRHFRAEVGLSFSQWRTLARIHRSIQLLCDGMAVTDVADAVGFEQPGSFIKAFRATVGTTPGAFRQDPTRWLRNSERARSA